MMLIGDQTLHMSAYIDKDISTWMDFDLLKLHYSKKILSIGVKISMPRHKHLSCRLEGKQTYCLLEMLISLVRDLLDAIQQIFNFQFQFLSVYSSIFCGKSPTRCRRFYRKKIFFFRSKISF